jgi:hypothetical protein
MPTYSDDRPLPKQEPMRKSTKPVSYRQATQRRAEDGRHRYARRQKATRTQETSSCGR